MSTHRFLTAISLLILTAASAQEPELRPTVSRQPAHIEGFVLEVGEHAIAEVIDKAATFLGRNYILASTEVGKTNLTVMLQTRMNLDAQGCEEVVSQLAYSCGLVMMPLDTKRGIWEWINLRGQRAQELHEHAVAMSPDEVIRRSAFRVVVTTEVVLEHCHAARCVDHLRAVVASRQPRFLTIGSADGRTTVVISGFADSVANIVRILRRCDEATKTLPPETNEAAGSSARPPEAEKAAQVPQTQTNSAPRRK